MINTIQPKKLLIRTSPDQRRQTWRPKMRLTVKTATSNSKVCSSASRKSKSELNPKELLANDPSE